jgi:hypothetical protein
MNVVTITESEILAGLHDFDGQVCRRCGRVAGVAMNDRRPGCDRKRPARVLTEPQHRFLESARHWFEDGPEERMGVIAKGSDRRIAWRLRRLGLLEYIGEVTEWEADEYDREWPGFRITEDGLKVAKQHRGKR